MHRIIVYLVPCDLGGICMLQIIFDSTANPLFVFLAINVGTVFTHSLYYSIAPDFQGQNFT